MRLGIMQPYFAPGLGYFDLVHIVDEWVVFDTSQYRRHSWMNRNRILHPTEGWQYITAEVRKAPRSTPIHAIALNDGEWQEHVLRQLGHYRLRAPFYEPTVQLLQRAFAQERRSLARLDTRIVEEVCALLGIPFRHRYFSEMDLDLGPVEGPGDWALRICEALGADTYVNPPGGRGIFDPARYRGAGVRLVIREFAELVYQPAGYPFLPTLSIVDVLMWNSPEVVRAFLDAARDDFERQLSDGTI